MLHIDRIVEELSQLKPAILQSAQHNFTEIAKALCESLLGRSIQLRPDLMANVIDRAIRDTLQNDSFSIRVHKEVFDALQGMNSFPHRTSLVADETIKQPEEFHIDSEITHVDGNIRKIIDEMLEQADLNLFEEIEEEGDVLELAETEKTG
jgi:flagellar biosynthesis/type III secretory pathway protein FliH